jgi:hypothetical protein
MPSITRVIVTRRQTRARKQALKHPFSDKSLLPCLKVPIFYSGIGVFSKVSAISWMRLSGCHPGTIDISIEAVDVTVAKGVRREGGNGTRTPGD